MSIRFQMKSIYLLMCIGTILVFVVLFIFLYPRETTTQSTKTEAPTLSKNFPEPETFISASTTNIVPDPIYIPDPDACSSNIIVDPGFEDSSLGAWTGDLENVKAFDPFIIRDIPRWRGDYFLAFGSYDSPTTAKVMQSVVIPATGNATLGFPVATERASVAYGDTDRFEVSLDGMALPGGIIFANNTAFHDGYVYMEFDISAWADGYSHLLKFQTIQTGSTNPDDLSNFLVDSVDISTGTNCEDNWGIDIAPGFLHFGRVATSGNTKQLTLSVINTGASPLIGSMYIAQPYRSTGQPYGIVGDLEYNIPPGKVETITVAFSPREEIARAGTLHFRGGGGFEIPLLGFSEPEIPFTNTATDVILTEIQAWNAKTLLDSDGDTPSWVELKNFNDFPVNVRGWKLIHTANDITEPAWVLPDIDIAAKGYLVILTSGKTDTTLDSGLHASFSLNKDTGGSLLFTRGDDSVTEQHPSYPVATAPDTSYSYQEISGSTNSLEPQRRNARDGYWPWSTQGSLLTRTPR